MDSNAFFEGYNKFSKELDMPLLVRKYLEKLVDVEATLKANSQRLGTGSQVVLLCRIPLPASIPGGYFIYKALGARAGRAHHILANEIHAMKLAAQWVNKYGGHEHARIPKYYCGSWEFTQGVEPPSPSFICMEYIPGTVYVQVYTEPGCRSWTFREKRRFVRQMALFRLSMLSMRGNYIGGISDKEGESNLCVSAAIRTRRVHCVGLPHGSAMPVKYYENLAPQPNTKDWTEQGIRREMAYWRDSLNKEQFESIIEDDVKYNWTQQSWIDFVSDRHINAPKNRRYRQQEEELGDDLPFGFSHNDIHHGFNVQMERGEPKMIAVIDWEMAMMVPYSIAIRDLFNVAFGIGDPNELIGEDIPFQLDMYWDHAIHNLELLRSWNDKTRARREKRGLKQGKGEGSQMNSNNFAAYGILRPQDLWYGDSLEEEADIDLEEEDDQDHFYFAGKRDYFETKSTPVLEPGTWYYEPVLHLMEQYLKTYNGLSKLCKWDDPYVTMWHDECRRMISPF